MTVFQCALPPIVREMWNTILHIHISDQHSCSVWSPIVPSAWEHTQWLHVLGVNNQASDGWGWNISKIKCLHTGSTSHQPPLWAWEGW